VGTVSVRRCWLLSWWQLLPSRHDAGWPGPQIRGVLKYTVYHMTVIPFDPRQGQLRQTRYANSLCSIEESRSFCRTCTDRGTITCHRSVAQSDRGQHVLLGTWWHCIHWKWRHQHVDHHRLHNCCPRGHQSLRVGWQLAGESSGLHSTGRHCRCYQEPLVPQTKQAAVPPLSLLVVCRFRRHDCKHIRLILQQLGVAEQPQAWQQVRTCWFCHASKTQPNSCKACSRAPAPWPAGHAV